MIDDHLRFAFTCTYSISSQTMTTKIPKYKKTNSQKDKRKKGEKKV